MKNNRIEKMAAPDFRPLYQQVHDILKSRLIKGAWKPGDLLPSEFQLADELKVSQGTVRKALDDMVAQNLLVRRQGRGTYVAQHDQQRSLFHFFKLEPDDGSRRLPTSHVLDIAVGFADPCECAALNLTAEDQVIRVERMRLMDQRPIMYEWLSLPQALFPTLITMEQLPNTLYSMYAVDFGITITSAREELRAVAADEIEARHLELPIGAPVLEIKRIAIALDGRPVELRISHCNTAAIRYVTELQ